MPLDRRRGRRQAQGRTNDQILAVNAFVGRQDVFDVNALILGNSPARIVWLNGVLVVAFSAMHDGAAGAGATAPSEEGEKHEQEYPNDDTELEQGHHIPPPRGLGSRTVVGQERLMRVAVITLASTVADLGQLTILVAWSTLPVASISILEGVDLGISIVANACHALRQPFFVGIVAGESRHVDSCVLELRIVSFSLQFICDRATDLCIET